MRNVLVIGGLLVVALVVGLWLLLGRDDTTTAQASPTPSTGPAAVDTPSSGRPTVTPGAPIVPSMPPPSSGENPRDYAVGDVRVRDHRAGDNKPLDIPPNAHPAEGRAIPSVLTHEISQKVRAVMMECVASVPKEARGEKPRLEGQIVIAIKASRLSITNSTMQLRNISGDAVEPTKRCIESKSIGLENSAPDQADLDNYSINISFAIP
jgi:hypothetical protein